MSKSKLGTVIEIARIIFIVVGINIGYWSWVDPSLRLEIMTAILILSLNGTVAFGLLVLGESASERIGYQADPAFQRQSGLNNLAMVIALVFVFILRWNVFAYLALLTACLVFFFLSSLNHTWSWLKEANKKTANVMRPFLTLLLIIAAVPAIVLALQSIH
jgi:Family of unknown function (DUF6790)